MAGMARDGAALHFVILVRRDTKAVSAKGSQPSLRQVAPLPRTAGIETFSTTAVRWRGNGYTIGTMALTWHTEGSAPRPVQNLLYHARSEKVSDSKGRLSVPAPRVLTI
jgi:hypothetical protein